ncbi:hypothetical protein [Bradyrhizobium sp. CSS354]|uniref:hypothetical protein n=1 Tax=Bradyrhizobium sp. CSS354 TaxID=2699172 RepID=UPI0023B06EED|nr:hypothetical protein [Bradyrhizobium sp. CSS354]MDE5460349.1 hypothetical protein [Bradyrhizobium sp. CSS354]
MAVAPLVMLPAAAEAASFACLKHSARIASVSFFGAASAGRALPSASTSRPKVLSVLAFNIILSLDRFVFWTHPTGQTGRSAVAGLLQEGRCSRYEHVRTVAAKPIHPKLAPQLLMSKDLHSIRWTAQFCGSLVTLLDVVH